MADFPAGRSGFDRDPGGTGLMFGIVQLRDDVGLVQKP